MTSAFRAIGRSRCSIFLVAGTYVVSILTGMVMVHAGNEFALRYRDQIVNQALQQDPAAVALNRGDNTRAALWDFAGNLALGAVPKTISGFAIVFPYPMVAYQGWIGGIVSVRERSHQPAKRSTCGRLLPANAAPASDPLFVGRRSWCQCGNGLISTPTILSRSEMARHPPKRSTAGCGTDLCTGQPPIPGSIAVGISKPVESLRSPLEINSSWLTAHSYRRASIGSTRAARLAGA
jgi:hypothetical protein